MTIEIGVTMITFGEIYSFRCWGHIIKDVSLKSMGKESRMNSPDDKGCIYGLGSLGVALSAPATSSSQEYFLSLEPSGLPCFRRS
ncbi:hypothetical protein OROHE_004777 [Orobanche hederae]